MSKTLFNPFQLGNSELTHRIVLAPMSRIRAHEHTLGATKQMAQYYEQRASHGGLLITEAIHISAEGMPVWNIYPNVRKHGGHVPGLWTRTQSDSWRSVVDAVHAKGGLISCQLLHAGRVAQPEIRDHPLVQGSNLPLPPVSASAIPIQPSHENGSHYSWDLDSTPPRALSAVEINRLIGDYQVAAVNAKRAGFDFVELHAAHGYLIDQFLNNGVNQREDDYGGSIGNRCRLLFEVVDSLIQIMGPNRVGVRLSPVQNDPKTGLPSQSYFGVSGSDPEKVYGNAISGLNAYPLAYLMLTEPRVGGLNRPAEQETAYKHPLANQHFREMFDGVLIGAGGFTPQTAERAIEEDVYDLIAFGRWFLANPDLPERIKMGYPLTGYDRDTFYGGDGAGYTDYPTWQEIKRRGSNNYSLINQERIGPTMGGVSRQERTKTPPSGILLDPADQHGSGESRP